MDGLGFLIWRLDKIMGLYSPVQLADLLNKANVSWVSWKVSNGLNRYNQIGGNDKLLLSYIDALSAAGIESGGWSYVYPRPISPGGQAGVISERVQKLNLSHLLLDVEAEWKAGSIAGKDIDMLINQIDVNLHFLLGFCSYRYPVYHPGIKYTRFLGNPKMKMNCPQVYWEDLHDPEVQLQRSFDQYKLITDKPFIPIGSSYGTGDWMPTTDDFECFVRKCIEAKWWTYGFYSLDWLLSHGRFDWLAAISGKTVTPPAPGPIPLPAHVITKSACNVRNAPDLTPASDIGDLSANKALEVDSEIGDWYKVKVYVSKLVVTGTP